MLDHDRLIRRLTMGFSATLVHAGTNNVDSSDFCAMLRTDMVAFEELLAPQITKGQFIATQLNSTRRRVELSCVAIDTLADATQLSPTIGSATDPVDAYSQSARSRSVELS